MEYTGFTEEENDARWELIQTPSGVSEMLQYLQILVDHRELDKVTDEIQCLLSIIIDRDEKETNDKLLVHKRHALWTHQHH